jgi:hypothetical protein
MPYPILEVSDNPESSPHRPSTYTQNLSLDPSCRPSSMPKEWPVRTPTENDIWIVHLWLGVWGLMFQLLCLAAFGLPEIEAVHYKMQGQWDEFKSNMKEMLNQASIIVSNI